MASTVTASTLTVTITENVVLNGQTYGNSISKSYTSQGEVDQRIMNVAMESLALQTALTFEKKNAEAAAMLKEQGVTLWEWSAEDLGKFRAASQAAWPEFATTPEAKALVASHMEYLTQLGLVK